MAELGERERELLAGGNLAHLATQRMDGSPPVSPAWVDVQGDPVPRVGLSVASRESDFRSVAISGTVVGVTADGAWDHAHRMARRYLEQDRYTFGAPGEVRLLIRIRPDRVDSIFV